MNTVAAIAARLWAREPALILGSLTALAAFGQDVAINGNVAWRPLIAAFSALIAGFVIRRRVSPVDSTGEIVRP